MFRTAGVRHRWVMGCVSGAALLLGAGSAVGTPPPAPEASPAPAVASPAGELLVLKVSAPNMTVQELADYLQANGFDLLEARSGNALLVQGDQVTVAALQAAGLRVKTQERLTPTPTRAPAGAAPDAPELAAAASFFGGYTSISQIEANLATTATTYPALTRLIDIGDSWRKVNALPGPHDLWAMCITNFQAGDCALAPGSAKPRLLVMASIHAREITTSEVAMKLISELTSKYGVDPEITSILDSTEVWVLPDVNPDGRDIVELGGNAPYLQRKNGDDVSGGACSNPPTASNQAGVDLNRNNPFKYGGTGTSTNPCDQTYRGVGAASEPETQALTQLFGQLFADAKGPNDTDAAPLTTPGALITLHSYSNLVLLPWGWTTTLSPNNAGLRAMAFRMSYYNGYRTGTGPEILYGTTGTTDDQSYGTLGVASFTFEIGPSSGTCSGFTPAFSCQANFWTLNGPALLQAAKLARQPYTMALGPTTRTAAVSAASVAVGTSVTLSASANDNAMGSASGSIGRPATQRITNAEYYRDVAPWNGGTAVAMTATDGNFNSTVEAVRATVSTTGWSVGRHTIWVRAKDLSGNWGPTQAVFLTVT